MKLLVNFLIFFGCFFALEMRADKDASWTVLVYMEADNHLNDFAVKNLYDMARVEKSDKLNVLVQWNQPNNNGQFRYRVLHQKVVLDMHIPADEAGSCVESLVDSVKWAQENYPADHFCIILWGEGLGFIESNETTRALLWKEADGSYMTNQQLVESLSLINVQLGRPIDVLAMDMGKMAMLEVAYQIQGKAKFFVASKDGAYPADGFAYGEFLSRLSSENLGAYQLAQCIVSTYAQQVAHSCLSAIDLDGINAVKEGLDLVLDTMLEEGVWSQVKPGIIAQAREEAKKRYKLRIDLYLFYEALERMLPAVVMDQLSTLINDAKLALKRAVIANEDRFGGHGISLYYPLISPLFPYTNYLNSQFAQDSLWPEFLRRSTE